LGSVDEIVLIVAAVGIEVCCILATGKLNAKLIEIIHVLLLFHLFHGCATTNDIREFTIQ
jgi:hypothetical protein